MTALATQRTIDRALDQFDAARLRPARAQKQVIGDEVDPDYCLGDWLSCIRKGDRERLAKVYYPSQTKSAMGESLSGTVGGYLVPVELSDGLMRSLDMDSFFRRFGALIVPMESAQMNLPLPDVTTAQSAGVAPYFGGIQLKPTAEQVALPETAEMTFREVVLKAWLLSGYALASSPLMQDGRGIEAFLKRIFAASVAWYEDYFFLQGTGVGQPQGVIKCGGAVPVTRGTTSQVTVADTQNMIDNLLPASFPKACWVCHPTVLVQMTAFSGWIPNGHLRLHGLPIWVTDQVPKLGTQGDLCLIDPTLYIVGDRSVEIAYTREEPTAYTKNQWVWRVNRRVDGQPWINAPITLADGSATASPYVILK